MEQATSDVSKRVEGLESATQHDFHCHILSRLVKLIIDGNTFNNLQLKQKHSAILHVRRAEALRTLHECYMPILHGYPLRPARRITVGVGDRTMSQLKY